ncbi:MAG: hypothetical protein C4574_03800 [Candidatus Latescibacterota bacterium]|jgi:hypothetical protein|nr:MAG: hypothetical protein C4574_03800 [Candidatus Latescibacterota bacterium]
MKTGTIASIAAIFVVVSFSGFPGGPGTALAQSEHCMRHGAPPPDTAAADTVYTELPGYGKKCWIDEEVYFTYKFDKKPKMGTPILIVQVFEKGGARVTDLSITGSYDMPSMRGAHPSGDVPFKLNKKGDYLLPVNVVMPGGWEVLLVFRKGDETIYRGVFRFDV